MWNNQKQQKIVLEQIDYFAKFWAYRFLWNVPLIINP